MKLIFSLLSLGTTAGGVIAGTLQQNLSQAEKPKIDILFEEIVKDMRKFSEENPINKEDFKNVKCAASVTDESKNNCKEEIEKIIKKANQESNTEDSEKNSSENLPQYTFQSLTNIWMGLLSSYIESWYNKENRWGTSDPYLKLKDEFTEKNKEKNFSIAENDVKKEKTELENKFSEKSEAKKEIQKIYEKIKDFILLTPLPENYNKSSDNDLPYENYIKKLVQN